MTMGKASVPIRDANEMQALQESFINLPSVFESLPFEKAGFPQNAGVRLSAFTKPAEYHLTR
jgi:hypothetical protein